MTTYTATATYTVTDPSDVVISYTVSIPYDSETLAQNGATTSTLTVGEDSLTFDTSDDAQSEALSFLQSFSSGIPIPGIGTTVYTLSDDSTLTLTRYSDGSLTITYQDTAIDLSGYGAALLFGPNNGAGMLSPTYGFVNNAINGNPYAIQDVTTTH